MISALFTWTPNAQAFYQYREKDNLADSTRSPEN
jgi:hypothetical protein